MESVHVERAEGAYLESKEVFYNTLSQLGGEEQYWFIGVTHHRSIRSPLFVQQDSPRRWQQLPDSFCLSVNVEVSAWIRRTCMNCNLGTNSKS